MIIFIICLIALGGTVFIGYRVIHHYTNTHGTSHANVCTTKHASAKGQIALSVVQGVTRHDVHVLIHKINGTISGYDPGTSVYIITVPAGTAQTALRTLDADKGVDIATLNGYTCKR